MLNSLHWKIDSKFGKIWKSWTAELPFKLSPESCLNGTKNYRLLRKKKKIYVTSRQGNDCEALTNSRRADGFKFFHYLLEPDNQIPYSIEFKEENVPRQIELSTDISMKSIHSTRLLWTHRRTDNTWMERGHFIVPFQL